MWNQNNGNGNGQGYYPQGGYSQPQDAYDRLDNAREVGGARFPYIAAGTHKLVLVSLEEFNPQAPKVRALFKTIESRTQQPGSFCVKIWSLVKPPRFPNGTTEADEFADFMLKLKNAPRGFAISRSIRTLLKERPAEQLARGTMIECTGVAGKPNPQNPGKEPYVRVYWNPIQQSEPDIAAMRMRLEQEGIPSTNDNGGQQGGPQQQYQQQPMQQGYPQQQQAPQQQMPQHGYQQQQMPAQQGYVQQPAQAPQQQVAPQGGFLAQAPVNNGGNQGNGGW